MTEGGAFSFVIRLLLGGALISGLLLYAAQSLQKGPAPAKEATTEKIGPTLSTRQAAPPPKPAAPAPVQALATPAAGPDPAAQPMTAPSGASALVPAPGPATGTGRVSNSYGTDPAPAPPASPVVTQPTTAQADSYGVVADETAGDVKPTPAAGRPAKTKPGQAGCQNYKSYNPATQTYRSFDGKIRDCKP